MSDSFSEVFDAPVVERIKGQEVTFPVLTLEDHAGWVASLHAFVKKRDEGLIPEDATAAERFEIRRKIAQEPNLSDVANTIFTLSGARKCLILSLKRAGKSESDAAATVNAVPARRLVSLAIDVSGLFDRDQDKQGKGGKPDPNGAKGDGAELQTESLSNGTGD